jgi:hypothetical protein
MAKIFGNLTLSVQNDFTDGLCIHCTVEVSPRIQTLFNKALEIFTPYAKPQEVNIFFVSKEFRFVFGGEQIGLCIKKLIAFDLSKLENYSDDFVLAAFLEEFAHCYLGIEDETEVGHKVCEIYPKLEFDGTKYVIKKG